MASNTIYFRNPNTGEMREAPVGYCLTVFFFGCFVPLFRSDWRSFVFIALAEMVTGFIFTVTSIVPMADVAVRAAALSGFIFAFLYNKMYITGLVKKGFQASGVDKGVLTEVVNKLDSSIPILEEPQTNQKSQEPEPKNENSTEDKLRQLNDLKEKNLINDEEYNKKKEKLLEEL